MPKSSATTSSLPAVSAERLTVAFDGRAALDRVTVDVPAGSVTAVIGPNGSGKTTFVKACLGLVRPTSGEVRVLGAAPEAARTHVGYVPQRFSLPADFPLTVAEFLEFHRRPPTPPVHAAHALREVGLAPRLAQQRVGNLSGGQLQRVMLAAAILNEPDVLFLDEPSSAVDVAGERTLYGLIRHLNADHGTTVVMVSHDLSAVAKAVDHVICLDRKLIAAGSPKDVLTHDTLAQLFGDEVHHTL
jgi:zinc transport system ATP-binding protein